MAAPTREALLEWAKGYVEHWNSGDKEACLVRSIEVFRFGDDGSVEIRTHYDVPASSDPVTGELFSKYLPEDG